MIEMKLLFTTILLLVYASHAWAWEGATKLEPNTPVTMALRGDDPHYFNFLASANAKGDLEINITYPSQKPQVINYPLKKENAIIWIPLTITNEAVIISGNRTTVLPLTGNDEVTLKSTGEMWYKDCSLETALCVGWKDLVREGPNHFVFNSESEVYFKIILWGMDEDGKEKLLHQSHHSSSPGRVLQQLTITRKGIAVAGQYFSFDSPDISPSRVRIYDNPHAIHLERCSSITECDYGEQWLMGEGDQVLLDLEGEGPHYLAFKGENQLDFELELQRRHEAAQKYEMLHNSKYSSSREGEWQPLTITKKGLTIYGKHSCLSYSAGITENDTESLRMTISSKNVMMWKKCPSLTECGGWEEHFKLEGQNHFSFKSGSEEDFEVQIFGIDNDGNEKMLHESHYSSSPGWEWQQFTVTRKGLAISGQYLPFNSPEISPDSLYISASSREWSFVSCSSITECGLKEWLVGEDDSVSLPLEGEEPHYLAFKSISKVHFELEVQGRYEAGEQKKNEMLHKSVYPYSSEGEWKPLMIAEKGLTILGRNTPFFPPFGFTENDTHSLYMTIHSKKVMMWKKCPSLTQCGLKDDSPILTRFQIELILFAICFALFIASVYVDIRVYRDGNARPQGNNGTSSTPTACGAAVPSAEQGATCGPWAKDAVAGPSAQSAVAAPFTKKKFLQQ